MSLSAEAEQGNWRVIRGRSGASVVVDGTEWGDPSCKYDWMEQGKR